jgi:adenosyl cobinamide kinase/adenosyl cobinamide phosphate guanylyltransferase
MGFVLLLGGARSGKSDRAARLAIESGMHVSFIATATAGDDEMTERISRHRSARRAEWSTVEAPLDLLTAVTATPSDRFVVVDCLTLWVSNLLGAGVSAEEVLARAEKAALMLAARPAVVVSNEVGLGIVPANALTRTFRDVLGGVNAVFARHAERSMLMVAGRTLELT